MGEEEEAREGCAGVDLEDISVVAHCPEYDSERGEVKGDSSPLALTMIRRGGLCHQGHCQGFFSILQHCFLRADRGQKEVRADRTSNTAILPMLTVKKLKRQYWKEMSMIPGSRTYPSLPPYPSFYLFLS